MCNIAVLISKRVHGYKKMHSVRNLFPIYLKLWCVHFSDDHFWTVCGQCWCLRELSCELSLGSKFLMKFFNIKCCKSQCAVNKHIYIMNKLKRLTHTVLLAWNCKICVKVCEFYDSHLPWPPLIWCKKWIYCVCSSGRICNSLYYHLIKKYLSPIRQCLVAELCLPIYCKMFDDFGVGSWIGVSKFSLSNNGRIFSGSVKKLKMDKSNWLTLFFVPCIVIQLCNVNQQMRTFQINVLIQFLVSSTCSEHHVTCSSSGRPFVCAVFGRMYRAHPSTCWTADINA
jgi:hypothetical protein